MVEHLVSDALKNLPQPSIEEAQAIMVDALRKIAISPDGKLYNDSASITAQRALIRAGIGL